MKLLVFGQTGQVARELAVLEPGAIFLDRAAVDLSDPAACEAAIQIHAPDAVINAAAYTAVDKAEDDEATAHLINAVAPGVMAKACADLGIPLVHISTDYVFEGTGTEPRSPDAVTGPLGVYGRTKLAGEQAVIAAGGPHAILRTSWVFSRHGNNFLKSMLRLGADRDHLTIVADQIGGPTPAKAIAQACLTIAKELGKNSKKSGIYHMSGAPDASWAEFARVIFAATDLQVTVEDIPTTAYPTPATRPLNSRLDCATLQSEFGITRPDWREAVTEIVGQLT